jgi:hypothetical protein
MLNLICFPHYTCGGLLCDIMTGLFSPIGTNGGIDSIHHSVGKIGDTSTVMLDYDADKFMQKVSLMDTKNDTWIGTHCWPGQLPLDNFNKILIVTTTTFKSKIYRWARVHHHYFLPTWKNLSGIDLVDKSRETAKNYLIPFQPVLDKPNVLNVEFADVVETTPEFYHAIDYRESADHMARWKEVNYFLYTENFWKSQAVDQFYQAELEINLGRYYRYI